MAAKASYFGICHGKQELALERGASPVGSWKRPLHTYVFLLGLHTAATTARQRPERIEQQQCLRTLRPVALRPRQQPQLHM